jgi:hypothetical protein
MHVAPSSGSNATTGSAASTNVMNAYSVLSLAEQLTGSGQQLATNGKLADALSTDVVDALSLLRGDYAGSPVDLLGRSAHDLASVGVQLLRTVMSGMSAGMGGMGMGMGMGMSMGMGMGGQGAGGGT